MYTKGVGHNLHEHEITTIVQKNLNKEEIHEGDLKNTSEQIAQAAKERAQDSEHPNTPFVKHGEKHGIDVKGGKDNDITVLTSIVVEKNEESRKPKEDL